MAESGQPLVYHIPQAHRQMVAVSAVNGDTLKAVSVMAARLLARAVVAGFAHLPQKFQLDLERFFLFALTVEVVLQDSQLISVYFHKYHSSVSCSFIIAELLRFRQSNSVQNRIFVQCYKFFMPVLCIFPLLFRA